MPLKALIIVLLHAALLTYSIFKHSPGIDEPTYFAAGVNHWRTGEFFDANVTPPGVRLIATSVVRFANYYMDWNKVPSENSLHHARWAGILFLNYNREHALELINLARLTLLPISLIGGILCFLWAKRLYGIGAGYVSLALWSFCPLILTNSQMITPDLSAAVFSLIAVYAFHSWQMKRSTKSLILCGVTLGMAQLMRTTLLILYPVFIVLSLLGHLLQEKAGLEIDRRKGYAHLFLIFLLSIFVLNLGYGFEGSFFRLELHHSSTLGFLSGLPVPLPFQYVEGIIQQLHEFDSGMLSYLLGEFRTRGWWYYYFVGLIAKLPLATLILIAFALVCRPAKEYESRMAELALLVTALGYMVLLSFLNGFSHHVRYALPILPLLYIFSGRVLGDAKNYGLLKKISIVGLIAWATLSSLSSYPHSHAFFNSFSAGGDGGSELLLDSNIDWGQDIHFLNEWIRSNPAARPMSVGYFGNSYTRPFDVPYEFGVQEIGHWRQWLNMSESAGPREGYYAISIHLLKHNEFFLLNGGTYLDAMADEPIYSGYFLNLVPEAIVGDSIYIYKLDKNKVQWIRSQLLNSAKL